jgi:hypothetical protein
MIIRGVKRARARSWRGRLASVESGIRCALWLVSLAILLSSAFELCAPSSCFGMSMRLPCVPKLLQAVRKTRPGKKSVFYTEFTGSGISKTALLNNPT